MTRLLNVAVITLEAAAIFSHRTSTALTYGRSAGSSFRDELRRQRSSGYIASIYSFNLAKQEQDVS